MKSRMRLYYDEKSDFLEIHLGEPSECYAEEVKPGVFVRMDEKTDEIKSIEILSFRERMKKFEPLDIPLPKNVELSS